MLEYSVHAVRQNQPPQSANIEYDMVIDTDEPDRRLALMHENIRGYGTICNAVAAAVALSGTVRRKMPPAA